MNYRVLGRTGVKVHPLCLGTMNFGSFTPPEDAHAILNAYTEGGGNFVDTANVYNNGQSESIIGDWMANENNRDEFVLSTKVHGKRGENINQQGNHRWHIVREVEESLKRLKTDRIDLYHIHRPDPDTPIDQTLRALDDLVRSGKVLYLASSTFPAWELAEAHFIAKELGTARFDVEQPPLNIIDRRIEKEVLPFCQRYDVATITWAPLARGRLAGKYTRGGRSIPDGSYYQSRGKDDFPPSQWPVMEGVDKLADERGCTSSQFSIAWCLSVPGVTCPILGPRTVEQLQDNMGAADIELTQAERDAVDNLVPPGELCRDAGLGAVPR
ncbi:aldo/keto reductase [Algisphaera agarilytica]|uniref:Aryl-alcohol dehydrogenase-like predicted oxidoreductase n=1 Tax=Algisphaera agarilytica TaxID=1385975 RepID=A0A7X0H5F1_9BACT|nr:aldo/keto reductase [Algisphaera agarilytica]MBB6429611.1 aryl-alcohol dehydrogenase-like predicted oxidoreductase [Algisphaera agarilytica]